MNLIEPSRLLELKERVKAECARRQYVGTVADYAEVDFDFSNTPVIDQKVLEEHYEKLAVPLNAINFNNTTDIEGLNRKITEEDFVKMEEYLSNYEQRDIQDMGPTDCAASCTGTCTTTCTGGCGNGCSGTCVGSCSGRCSGGCKGCRGTCKGSCSGSCTGCSGTCEGGCSGGCSTKCSVGCIGTCYTSCSNGCDTGCSKACGYCGVSCAACRNGGESATYA